MSEPADNLHKVTITSIGRKLLIIPGIRNVGRLTIPVIIIIIVVVAVTGSAKGERSTNYGRNSASVNEYAQFYNDTVLT